MRVIYTKNRVILNPKESIIYDSYFKKNMLQKDIAKSLNVSRGYVSAVTVWIRMRQKRGYIIEYLTTA